jgi:hypothetical protein
MSLSNESQWRTNESLGPPALQKRKLCAGLNPVEAHNVVHAGLLFALQIARLKHGPMGRCSKLDLRGSIRSDGATFEAVGGVPPRSEPYRFTVLIDRQSNDRLSKSARMVLAHVAGTPTEKMTPRLNRLLNSQGLEAERTSRPGSSQIWIGGEHRSGLPPVLLAADVID